VKHKSEKNKYHSMKSAMCALCSVHTMCLTNYSNSSDKHDHEKSTDTTKK